MRHRTKIGIVLAGYVLAFAAAALTIVIYDRQFTPADFNASGGMIGGGELMYGTAAFLFVSAVPTGLALLFLRRHRVVWSLFTAVCLAFTIVGLAGVFLPVVVRGLPPHLLWRDLVDLVGLAQMLGAPLWIGGFALFAALAPAPRLRRCMLAALAIELVIGICGFIHFTFPAPPI